MISLINLQRVVLKILQKLLSKQLHLIKKCPISVQLSFHSIHDRFFVALLQQTGQVGENLPPRQRQFSLLFTQISLVLAQVIFQAESKLSHTNIVFVFVGAQLRCRDFVAADFLLIERARSLRLWAEKPFAQEILGLWSQALQNFLPHRAVFGCLSHLKQLVDLKLDWSAIILEFSLPIHVCDSARLKLKLLVFLDHMVAVGQVTKRILIMFDLSAFLLFILKRALSICSVETVIHVDTEIYHRLAILSFLFDHPVEDLDCILHRAKVPLGRSSHRRVGHETVGFTLLLQDG